MNRNVLSQYPTLRRLELGSRRRLTTDDMELILPAFPLLEHLAIRPITDSRLLSLMHTYCPNLSFLEYNTPLIRDKLPTPSTASKAETAGLRFLYIELNDPSNDLKDVIDITMRHHKTLEHLVINLKENQRYDQLSPLFDATTLTFNKLAHVHFGIREIDGWESPGSHDERLIQEGLRLFATILRQSPNLQTLRLGGEALNPQVLYPSLGHIRHLNKIVIGNHTSVFVDDAIAFGKEDMLQQVLDEHVHQSITSAVHPWSQLKHLKFKCYGLSVSLLESITRLPQLETLNIDISRPLGNDQVDFIKKLANGCPQLSDFTLRTNVIPDLVIYHLSLLKQLRHLTLLVQHHINDAAVLSLSACHQLRTLTIPSVVNRDAIEFLKIALPNLNIVICTLETMEW